MTMNISKYLFISSLALLFAITLTAEDKHHKDHDDHEHDAHEHHKHDAEHKTEGAHKDHDDHAKHAELCPVSGEELDADAVSLSHEGQTLRFCCKKCLGKFKKNPAKYAKKGHTDHYPLATCVISGKKLGSMGKAFEHEHKGQRVRLCCKGCLKKFNKAPETHLKKISDAAHKNHDH